MALFVCCTEILLDVNLRQLPLIHLALSCALFCFVFKFKDIVDVVDGIFQEFSLPTFYKVHYILVKIIVVFQLCVFG